MDAVAITRGWEKWSAPHASNTGERFVGTVVVPDDGLAQALLERLVARSNIAEGFDRETLKDLNRRAWGITDR